MFSEVAALVSSVNSIVEIVNSFKDIAGDAAITTKTSELLTKVVEMQRYAIEAQSAQGTLIKRISELEKEVCNLKNWEMEKGKYYLRDISGLGTYVYALKDEPINKDEIFHQLCSRCYEKQCKSILQFESRNRDDNAVPRTHYTLTCHNCKDKIQVHKQKESRRFNYLQPEEALV